MSTITTDEFFAEHGNTIHKTALKHHKQSNLFSVEDIEQEINEFMLRSWENVKDLTPGNVRTLADKTASKYCRREREDWMYFQGSVIYSGDMVEKALETVWEPLEYGMDVEGRLDVTRALDVLTHTVHVALYKKFGLKEKLTNAEHNAVERGIRSITNYLNSRIQWERKELAESANHA